ncbi:hypothetical protein [Eubacterium sp.]|uniref:hypothetical protein n=1 Tax=Eubacterium sp. TaxID=142586 RepID=UPI003AB3756C
MEHHTLDPYPVPKEKAPLYVNEPWLIDKSLDCYKPCREPEDKPDNIRVYIPLDINHNAILRRLDRIIAFYREVNWKNEMDFNEDVSMILSQLEIYDRIWYIRHMPQEGEHSKEGITLVKEFVARLEAIPDGCAEKFPFDMIEELKREYLGEKENTEK